MRTTASRTSLTDMQRRPKGAQMAQGTDSSPIVAVVPRADRWNRHAHGVVAHHTTRNKNTGKITPPTLSDTNQPDTLTVNIAEQQPASAWLVHHGAPRPSSKSFVYPLCTYRGQPQNVAYP